MDEPMVTRYKVSRNVNEIIAAGIAITVMLGVIISATYILFWPIPERNETLVGQMQGSLWTALGMLVTYYFGSSNDAKEKTETITSLANTVGKAEGKADELLRQQNRSHDGRTTDHVDIEADTVNIEDRRD